MQVSYAIGVAEPLSVTVFDYGTGAKSSAELNEIVKKNFDLRYWNFFKRVVTSLTFAGLAAL